MENHLGARRRLLFSRNRASNTKSRPQERRGGKSELTQASGADRQGSEVCCLRAEAEKVIDKIRFSMLETARASLRGPEGKGENWGEARGLKRLG